MKCYAGIGSRETPSEVLGWMSWLSGFLSKKGFTLRSGGAKGADSAFEKNATRKEIFLPTGEIPSWCFVKVQKYLPQGYNWTKMKPYVKNLLARNMMQILGRDGKSPVDFVICWTKDGKDSGGTGYALRAAQDHQIPIYNLFNEQDRETLKVLLKTFE